MSPPPTPPGGAPGGVIFSRVGRGVVATFLNQNGANFASPPKCGHNPPTHPRENDPPGALPGGVGGGDIKNLLVDHI